MATLPKVSDTLIQYVIVGVIALGLVVLANKASWVLWVLVPVAIVVSYYLVRTPRDMLPAAARPVKAARRSAGGTTADRRAGWNGLGSLNVRPEDSYLVLKGELPPDGVTVPVPPGRWFVHARSEWVTQPPVHMRDAEVRIVQNPRWVSEEWDWTSSWEPLLSGHQGSASQAGRLGADAGLVRVSAGRRSRGGRTVTLQPGFSDGAYGVNVIRDLSGQVVAVVSRFG
jgi:hypothetical protein